jgi:hypothetical protein
MGWPGRAPSAYSAGLRLGRRYAKRKEPAMRTSQKTPETITTIGIDLGKNTFHLGAGRIDESNVAHSELHSLIVLGQG